MSVMTCYDFVWLPLVWIAWCSLHSLMITRFRIEYGETRLRSIRHGYRLFYNLVAVVTFLAAYAFTRSLPQEIVYEFTGAGNGLRIVILSGAILLLIGGAFSYDLFYFLGIRQIFTDSCHQEAAPIEKFRNDGLLNVTRHPWYLAGLMLVWTGSAAITDAELITKAIWSGYLIVGTYLEEKKLIRRFGDRYRQFQTEVSMLFPFKWFMSFRKKQNP